MSKYLIFNQAHLSDFILKKEKENEIKYLFLNEILLLLSRFIRNERS
jgi:hypothetical protein